MKDILFESAKSAINKLFSDTNRPRLETMEKLEELKDEIDELSASLDRNS